MNQEPEKSAESVIDPKLRKALIGAASALQSEARKILKKYPDRLSEEVAESLRASVAAIDTAKGQGNQESIAEEAHRIDELLAIHAGFARKSSLRETVENVGFAVVVALVLRAVLYEPFNIPSGSMFPTLQNGDHIFVNKFTHGIQVPFTSKVLLEDLFSPIGRGEVIVFRFPLDPTDDYIKRVIGTPGDVLKFQGEKIWIQRAGTKTFELIERKKLDRRCRDEEDPAREVNGCDLYEEVLDDHTYIVRYVRDAGVSHHGEERIITIPEASYLVLGDNRRRSQDSLMWMVTAPSVSASGLLSLKDLRSLSGEAGVEVVPVVNGSAENGLAPAGSQDSVKYRAHHDSPGHIRELEMWRKPFHGGIAMFEALSRTIGESKSLQATTMGALLRDEDSADSRLRERAKSIGTGIDRLEFAENSEEFEVIAYLAPIDQVVRLRCGKLACKTSTSLGLALADVLAAAHDRPEAPAAELLDVPKEPDYALRSDPSRTRVSGRLIQSKFAPSPDAGETDSVELLAVRGTFEGTRILSEAALAQAHSDSRRALLLADLPGRNYVVEDQSSWHLILAQESQNVFAHLKCGKRWCPDGPSAQAWARKLSERLPAAGDQAHRLRELVTSSDFNGANEYPMPIAETYPWDRVQATATIDSPRYEAEVSVRLNPSEGGPAALARWSSQATGVKAESSFGTGTLLSSTEEFFEVIFVRSDAVVRIRCGKGLCVDEEGARKVARRAYDNAERPANFINDQAMVPRPFVPRGNIKGRAEVIWLPMGRFGTAIP